MSTVSILPARARTGVIDYGPNPTWNAHLVLTDSHTGPTETALCGFTARFGWSMLPSPATTECPRCVKLYDEEKEE